MAINLDIVETKDDGRLWIKLSGMYYPLSSSERLEAKGRKIPDSKIKGPIGNLRGTAYFIPAFLSTVSEMKREGLEEEIEDIGPW